MSAKIVANVTTSGNLKASNVLASNVFQFAGPEVLTSSGATNSYKLTVLSPSSLATFNMTLTNPPQGTIIIEKKIIPTKVFSISVSENSNTWTIPESNIAVFSWVLDRWILATIPFISALYTFTTATFTSGGASGSYGPTLSQARSGLTGTPAPSNWYNTYLNMTTQGIQLWTVPATGSYTITAAGGIGGYNGMITTGTFTLAQGEVIAILCGQTGTSRGGGGGTFVVRSPYTSVTNCLIVAGGGGGTYGGGTPGSAGQSGSAGACAGNCAGAAGRGGANGGGGGGGMSGSGSGGGGFLGNGGRGATGVYSCCPGSGGNGGNGGDAYCGSVGPANSVGFAFINGGIGGLSDSGSNAGGFGGGGGFIAWNLGGGGGGGYSGGGGGGYSSSPNSCGDGVHEGGGGGGSVNNGTSTSFSATNAAAGYVTITKL